MGGTAVSQSLVTYLGIHHTYCGFAANIHFVSSRWGVIESHDDVVCVCVCEIGTEQYFRHALREISNSYL